MDWKKQKVLIIGAGKQGTALARFLCGQGAAVILNDNHTEQQLASAIETLRDCRIEWVLGEHPLRLLDGTTLVCPSGGVPLGIPIITEAVRRGIPLSNDSQVFMQAAPCKVIGITGSAGKTTTTTLVGRMAQAAAENSPVLSKAWIGGNIGNPLIADVLKMRADDTAVVEFSSFQTELMTTAPHISAVLNLAPNHLDRHGTMKAYTAAKANLLKFQQPEDIAVLSRDDVGSLSLKTLVKGRLLTFGLTKPEDGLAGTYIQDGQIRMKEEGREFSVMPVSEIELRGPHNLQNVLAACVIGLAAGFSIEAIQTGVRDFTGVEHRLEFVRIAKGVKWYNDSKATTPKAVMMSINSFDEPIVLLAGGRDKALPWEEFAILAARKVDHLILFGEAGGLIEEAIRSNIQEEPRFSLDVYPSLHPAVNRAASLAEEGDVVLLAPGCTSFDEFNNFEERGIKFKEWVNEL